ncbi:gastrula zinc finger protein XlCGF26.1-like [Diorhabda sublineata]|uniref:gastrula zinc finger protein XlCGF26.1-like n=1 Tax=Diorhabda sublineata TaxID=1163346 RepID=UPI0024E0B3A9|nr:gastrula zinc finger protein XlCGF26.1-like [Diorhabda sublineata]XP_056643107.1 gastrula zinc finger protein XlCGF26.1-like [Diorhabda sublineata]
MSVTNCLINKCRICFHGDENQQMHPFFDSCLEDISLATVFVNITSIQIQKNDCFPKTICTSCKTNIVNFKNMLLFFQKTENFLKKHICEKKVEYENELHSFRDIEFAQNVDYFDDNDHSNETDICGDGDFNSSVMNRENKPPVAENRGNQEYNNMDSFKYTCQCGDCFLYKSGFRQHMQYKHSILLEDGDFEQYSEKITLKIPIGFPNNVEFVSSKVTIRTKNLRCRICDESFLTKDEVKSHEVIHKTFICDHCGAAFLKKNYLVDHLRIHSEERHYECKICQKTFKHRYTYSVHKRSHEFTRNFVCETCGTCFKTRGTMRTHIRIKHSNIRNYSCSDCNLTFNLKSTLNKHFARKHTPDRKKSFVCNKCGAAYLNKNTLTRHITEKHLGMAKYFPCTICENKMYVMKKGLKAHMLKKHGIVYE